MIPTHHMRAIHISFPTGSEFRRERTDSTIEVTGWFSANARTILGIVSVGTKAELRKGKKSNGYANEDAPSMDFAVSPGMTAIHVRASVYSASIPAAASQSSIPALERKPIISATTIIITTVSMLETREVST
jgi:hypothetical protein